MMRQAIPESFSVVVGYQTMSDRLKIYIFRYKRHVVLFGFEQIF